MVDEWGMSSFPVRDWTGPEDSRRLKLPYLKTIDTTLRW
jgi:hypothetical protein